MKLPTILLLSATIAAFASVAIALQIEPNAPPVGYDCDRSGYYCQIEAFGCGEGVCDDYVEGLAMWVCNDGGHTVCNSQDHGWSVGCSNSTSFHPCDGNLCAADWLTCKCIWTNCECVRIVIA